MFGLLKPASVISSVEKQVLGSWSFRLDWVKWNATRSSLLILIGAALLWFAALSTANLSAMGDFGLLSVLPVTYYGALALLIINISMITHQQRVPEIIFVLNIVLLIFIIHGTPQILYGNLRYSWAWKHLGIIDHIQRYGTVDPTIDSLPAYHNWPGFFAVNTFLLEVAGLDTALGYAGWAPVFFNLIDLTALMLIFRSGTRDRRQIWLAIWFFFITNWVGQDYFSPQATNFFLHLVILGVCLTWFKLTPVPRRSQIERWLRSERISSWMFRLLYFARRAATPNAKATPAQRMGLLALLVIIFISVSSSHQLTPLMTIVSLAALVLFVRISIQTLPIIFGIIVMLWLVYMAVPFLAPTAESFIESLGRPTENTELIDLTQASRDQLVVALVGRSLTFAVMGLATLGILRQLLHGYLNLAYVLLIAAPVSTLAMNTYGGEIIFRVYLFALPFAAFFVAVLFYPTIKAGKTRWTALFAGLLSGVFLIGLLFPYYGKERQFHFSDGEVAASQYLHEIARPGSLIIEGSRNYPSQFHHYDLFTYVAIDREPFESKLDMIAHPVSVLTRWMSNRSYPAAYLIITRSQKAAVQMVGSMPDPDSLSDIENALLKSARFQIIYRDPDAIIFVLERPEPRIQP